MPLAPGTRLGPYEILAAAGAGGMGEVYKARDTRLGRADAIKGLPQHLSAAPRRRPRLARAAHAASALHPPTNRTPARRRTPPPPPVSLAGARPARGGS